MLLKNSITASNSANCQVFEQNTIIPVVPTNQHNSPLQENLNNTHDEGEGEVAFFSAKRWDRRNRADLIESATPCHDAHVVGPYRDSNPLCLTILAAMSEDYTTAPQHLQAQMEEEVNSMMINLQRKPHTEFIKNILFYIAGFVVS